MYIVFLFLKLLIVKWVLGVLACEAAQQSHHKLSPRNDQTINAINVRECGIIAHFRVYACIHLRRPKAESAGWPLRRNTMALECGLPSSTFEYHHIYNIIYINGIYICDSDVRRQKIFLFMLRICYLFSCLRSV